LRRLNYKTLVVWGETPFAAPPTALGSAEASVRKDGALAITYRAGETSIEELLARLRAAGVAISDLATEEPDLEDVFLALTSER
jgi:ABC-2 type transport system ATP-binding protein